MTPRTRTSHGTTSSRSTAPALTRAARRLLGGVRLLRRRALVHRRWLAAGSAGLAVLAGLQATAPPPEPTRAVLTAARDLPGGTRLQAGDLALVEVPTGLVPTDALSETEAATGRTLAAPLTRGEMLTSVRTVGPGLLAGHPGRTAVPVRILDSDAVDLLRVGDTVTLVAGDPEGRLDPATVATGVPVLALPRPRAHGLSSPTPGRLVVVAVPPETAPMLVSRSISGQLGILWG